MKPIKLPVTIVINHDKDIAVANSDSTPINPRNKTKEPSLIPSPEIDTGIMVKMIISGMNIRHASKGICFPKPIESIYTVKIPIN